MEKQTATLRHASLDDIPDLIKMGKILYEGSSYANLRLDESRIRMMLEKFIIEGTENFLVLISHDNGKPVGSLVAYAFQPLFSSEKMATEVLLWLEPDYRTTQRGKELLDAYEYWAKLIGCTAVQYGLLSTADPRLAKFYERRGAEEIEKVYVRRL